MALLRRDVRVAARELPIFLTRTILQPTLFVLVFGYLLPRMGFVQRAYTAALLPGIVGISLALSAIMAVAFPLVADFGWTKEIEDRLLAPVPTSIVAVEKVVSGALQGIVAAVAIVPIARLIMGPIPGLTLSHAGLLLLMTVLGAAAFSSLGLFIGTAINPQHVMVMFNLILAPMIFFGCSYYPWRGLDRVPVLKYLVLVNPLVYVSEGMRSAMTPTIPHMSIAAVVTALLASIVLFAATGLRMFEKRAIG